MQRALYSTLVLDCETAICFFIDQDVEVVPLKLQSHIVD